MTDYVLHRAIKEASADIQTGLHAIAKAISDHSEAQIVAAKIEANGRARAADLLPTHRDVPGAR